jgi:hypothetical protein
MEITKEKFCSAIRELKYSEDLQQSIAKAVNKYNNQIHSDYPERYGMVVSHEFLVAELLEIIMDDESEDISYFCFELNYGSNYKPGCVTDENGNDLDFSTPESLYDYLIKKKEDKDEN